MIVFAHLKLAEMPELGIKSSQYPSIIWRVWVGNSLYTRNRNTEC